MTTPLAERRIYKLMALIYYLTIRTRSRLNQIRIFTLTYRNNSKIREYKKMQNFIGMDNN